MGRCSASRAEAGAGATRSSSANAFCTAALPLYERALKGYEKELGPNHPETLDILQNMAALFQVQGKYEDALPLYERVLKGYQKELGPTPTRSGP